MKVLLRFSVQLICLGFVCLSVWIILQMFRQEDIKDQIINDRHIKDNKMTAVVKCSNIVRPKTSDLLIMNSKWHYVWYNYTAIHFLGSYLDERSLEGGLYIRLYPILTAPVGQIPDFPVLYVMLWYETLEHPLSVECICLKNASIEFWTIKEKRYGNAFYSCRILGLDYEQHSIPTHVSVVTDHCNSPTSYLKLHQSEKSTQLENNDIKVAVCAKTIYGDWTVRNVSYFVSWMETHRSLGVQKVFLSESGLATDTVFRSLLNYYQDIGFLNLEFIPINLYETKVPEITSAVSQSTVIGVVNHCYGKIWNTYDYVIHVDIDEILVPRNHATYSDMLKYLVVDNPSFVNKSCFVSRSAYFYLAFPENDDDVPTYIDTMRKVYRTPVEYPHKTWLTKGTGVQKAIDNAKTCLMLNIHGCGYRLKDRDLAYFCLNLPENILLSHHFRGKCQMRQRCLFEWERRVKDVTIEKFHGKYLRENVYNVLKEVGYFNGSQIERR